MATPIKPKRSYTATNVPSGLSAGELAVNAADGKVWIGSSDGKSNVLISSLSLSDMAGTTSNVTEGSNLYYTDSRARLSLSAGTGISYDNATGIITNSEPDQIVSLTGGTDISVTGTYPDFTIDFDGNTSYLPLSGGTMTGSITSFGTTHDTEVSGDFFGVQLSSDHTQGTMLNFDGLDTYSGASHMKVIPTGLTFPDKTTQTTAYTGGAGVTSIIAGTGISVDTATGDVTITNEAPDQTVSLTDGTGISVTGTYPDFTIATTITQYTDSDARKSLSAGTGISYDNTTGIITNSAPDQTVSLTAGTGISVTGTYPEFTITNSSPSGGGTVTSIATTSPITGGTITGSGTIGINASSTNTASYVVQRDASGNFSAGTITANLTGTASTATNLAAGSGGTIPYQSAAGTTAMLANGTAGQLLQANGGTSAPSWVASPGVPTGSLMPYAGSAAPTGYLLCDASAVSRTTYSALFAVLSTTYGAGDGSTTFNLPDLRGRLPMGAGTGSGQNASGTGKPSGTAQTARTAGQWFGEETHLLTSSEMASHQHSFTPAGSLVNAGSHNHTSNNSLLMYVGSGGGANLSAGTSYQIYNLNATIQNNGDHTHTFNGTASNTGATGGGGRHDIIPPCVVLNYIIKT